MTFFHSEYRRGRGLCAERPSDRQGVALVLVLGFLAILTLLAVTFAITLRTERLVSRSYLDQVKAEMLLEMALARALATIEEDLETIPYPDPFFFLSEGVEDGALDESVWDYIPAALSWDSADVQRILTRWAQRWGGAPADYWKDPQQTAWTDTPSGNGRYAFYAVDTSGFMDAHVPMATNRSAGFTTSELIPVEEVGNDPQAYNRIREHWVRLFDQAELTSVFNNVPSDFLFPHSFAPPEWDTIPIVLDQADDGIYHYINQNGEADQLTVPANIGPVRAPSWLSAYAHGNQPAHRLALDAHNGDLARIFRDHWEDMLDHLRDDTEIFPSTNTTIGSAEPWDSLGHASRAMSDLFGQYNLGKGVINAFAGDRFRSELGVGHYRQEYPHAQPTLHVTQVWSRADEWPFDEDGELIIDEDVTTILIDTEIHFTNLSNIDVDLRLLRPFFRVNSRSGWTFTGKWGWAIRPDMPPPDPLNLPFDFYPGDAAASLPRAVNKDGATGNIEPEDLALATGREFLGPGETIRINFIYLMDFGVDVRTQSARLSIISLERALGSPASYYTFMRFLNLVPHGGILDIWLRAPGERLFEADDPRIMSGNRRPSSLGPGAFIDSNQMITYDWLDSPRTTYNQSRKDGTRRIYNVLQSDPASPNTFSVLDSVSHIGRQPFNNEPFWMTVPLVGNDPAAADVARYFVMTPETYTNRLGRININSPFPEVLASGFMAANTNMDGTNYEPLSEDDALRLARLLLDHRPAGGFTNTVDAWRSASRQEWGAAFDPPKDKFQTEEVIARSMHLFTTRQQIFTVFVAAQELNAGEPSSEARAVAVIWRDPFRTNTNGELNPNGRHRLRVLSYRML